MASLSQHSSRLILTNTRAASSRSSGARVGLSAQHRGDGRSEHTIPRRQPPSLPQARPSLEKPVPKYRSKHYDSISPSNEPTAKILLEPHILSGRLKKLCDDRRIDDAVAMLKNSPLDAQNVPVWNTLIWECLKAERFRLGYDLYIDVCLLNISSWKSSLAFCVDETERS